VGVLGPIGLFRPAVVAGTVVLPVPMAVSHDVFVVLGHAALLTPLLVGAVGRLFAVPMRRAIGTLVV
jgi:hypothetical protein